MACHGMIYSAEPSGAVVCASACGAAVPLATGSAGCIASGLHFDKTFPAAGRDSSSVN